MADRKSPQDDATLALYPDLDSGQREMVYDLASFVAPRLGIDVIPCRGAWYNSIKRWQVDNHLAVSVVSDRTPPERARAAMKIRDNFREIASEMLDAEHRPLLQGVLDEAFRWYLDKHNQRVAETPRPMVRRPTLQ